VNNALAILTHAIRMLLHEPGTTLRVIAPALLGVLASVIAAAILVPDALIAIQSTPDTFVAPAPSSAMLLLFLSIAGLIGYALMAILWHRYVLINGADEGGHIKAGFSVLLGYLWRAIILALVQFLIAIPVGIAIAVFGGMGAAMSGGLTVFLVVGVLAGIFFIWVALRLSVVLPAAALGQTMRITESWQVTATISNALWGVAVLLALMNLVISLISNAILPDGIGMSVIMQTLIFIIEGLVFISVLTTLYGHLVEGRSLD